MKRSCLSGSTRALSPSANSPQVAAQEPRSAAKSPFTSLLAKAQLGQGLPELGLGQRQAETDPP